MGCQVFGRREGVPYYVVPTAGIEDQVFCMIDATATKARGVKVATAGATVAGGLVGVVQTGVWHGHYGTAADVYPQDADINVVSNGQVRVKISQTTSTETDYLGDGDLVTVGSGGKAVKYAAATITPEMTATLGDTYSKTEIAAYIAEYVADYVGAAGSKIVGRCIGDPVGGLVCVELIGLGGIQQG